MIPNNAHLVWVGGDLPWIHGLAPITAARYGGFDKVFLHHDRSLSAAARTSLLRSGPGIELREIDPVRDAEFRRLGSTAFSNRIRVRLLSEEGGVYLDMDTLTLSSFGSLRDSSLFCGEECVVFSEDLRASRSPCRWSRALALASARRMCRWSPGGLRLFRRMEARMERRVSNAVMGAESGHPLLLELMEAMEGRIGDPRVRPKDLGVRLLQKAVRDRAPGSPGLPVVHGQDVFFPIPPDVSAHWFRDGSKVDCLNRITDRTRCVHWYASLLEGRDHLDADWDWVRERKGRVGVAGLVDALFPAGAPSLP